MTVSLGFLFVGMIWVLPLFALGATARIARGWYHRKDRRNPLTRGMLRGPGHSLRENLVDLQWEFATLLAAASGMPLFAFGCWSIQQLYGPNNGKLDVNWLLGLGITGVVVGAVKTVLIVRQLRNTRLGLEAETAVGQELDQLMKQGFSVFHDLPGDKDFNIDHVVVGPQGVFAVETKGRSKPIRADGGDGHRVEYKDGQLRFPGWTEREPLEQAKRNAQWLKRWLSSAVGVPIGVNPVLTLPGWYVVARSRPEVMILNGINCGSFFAKVREEPLNDQLVRQIVHQLDARCRDIQPTTYRRLES
jgi:hypothetical protein